MFGISWRPRRNPALNGIPAKLQSHMEIEHNSGVTWRLEKVLTSLERQAEFWHYLGRIPASEAYRVCLSSSLRLRCFAVGVKISRVASSAPSSFVAVRLRSFVDFPFLSDRKLRHFDRIQQRELACCEVTFSLSRASSAKSPKSAEPKDFGNPGFRANRRNFPSTEDFVCREIWICILGRLAGFRPNPALNPPKSAYQTAPKEVESK
ncbi:hypothetical protein MA16_Dca000945 [Dendrobium catenatum]|uniref:Uncharacterized protein n=1 Tax=Dendrobium catenatum TaxID=906689 RepID=A0A2I0WVA5_9ASPA|nr:hypothetical protein MA16_Dca000945 [Dendrobium catenatum]